MTSFVGFKLFHRVYLKESETLKAAFPETPSPLQQENPLKMHPKLLRIEKQGNKKYLYISEESSKHEKTNYNMKFRRMFTPESPKSKQFNSHLYKMEITNDQETYINNQIEKFPWNTGEAQVSIDFNECVVTFWNDFIANLTPEQQREFMNMRDLAVTGADAKKADFIDPTDKEILVSCYNSSFSDVKKAIENHKMALEIHKNKQEKYTTRQNIENAKKHGTFLQKRINFLEQQYKNSEKLEEKKEEFPSTESENTNDIEK